MQVVIVYYLVQLLSPKWIDSSEKIVEDEVGLSRFMTGVLLHYAMTDHIAEGLLMMKFAINHPWKFKDPNTAIFCGLSKIIINLTVEILNYSLLMTSNDVLNCLWNFLGLNVVRRIGNYIYNTLHHSPLKKKLNNPEYMKVFTVQTTTSYSAKEQIPEHLLKKDPKLKAED